MNSRTFQYMNCRSYTGRPNQLGTSIRQFTWSGSYRYLIHWDNCQINLINENYWFPSFPWRPHNSKLFTIKLHSIIWVKRLNVWTTTAEEKSILLLILPQQHLGFPYRVFPLPKCILIGINVLFNQNIAQHPYKHMGPKYVKKLEKVAQCQWKLLSR